MFKVSSRKPPEPLRIVYQMSQTACKAYEAQGYSDEIFEVSPDTFVMTNPKSGNVWVSSKELLRTQLVHAQMFEKKLIESFARAD